MQLIDSRVESVVSEVTIYALCPGHALHSDARLYRTAVQRNPLGRVRHSGYVGNKFNGNTRECGYLWIALHYGHLSLLSHTEEGDEEVVR